MVWVCICINLSYRAVDIVQNNCGIKDEQERIQFEDATRSEDKENNVTRKNFLDGCYHVYLDVGSNIGVQVRKLYQQELFPGAEMIEQFKLAFGDYFMTNRDFRHICVVGFEPNPRHTPSLLEIQEEYTKCGWHVRFYTETAVSNYHGRTDFYTDSRPNNNEMGAGIVGENVNLKGKSACVDVVRLSDFVLNVVARRSVPPTRKQGGNSIELMEAQELAPTYLGPNQMAF